MVRQSRRDHYRPQLNPNSVKILHHKTNRELWIPLFDGEVALFPEAIEYTEELSWEGRLVDIDNSRIKTLVREARRAAKLPDHVTLAACRHGGMTELGDAEVTEQGVMALSGHRTPQAARLYVKRTQAQQLLAARKRRALVDRS